jgi:prevent-host-death family protein
MTTTVTSRDFNQRTDAAKRAAAQGPVIVTDRGRPSHVLLSYSEFERLRRPHVSLAEALAGPAELADIDLPLERSSETARVVDLS